MLLLLFGILVPATSPMAVFDKLVWGIKPTGRLEWLENESGGEGDKRRWR